MLKVCLKMKFEMERREDMARIWGKWERRES